MTRRNTDEDTETGLKRKTWAWLGKLAVAALLALAAWVIDQRLTSIEAQVTDTNRKVDEMNTRLSRMEGRVNMTALDIGKLLALSDKKLAQVP